MHYSIEMPLAFDILDAATEDYLQSFVLGFVTFEREQVTLGSAIHHLSQHELGILGTIKLRKSDEKSTTLKFYGPPRPKNSEVLLYLKQTLLPSEPHLSHRVRRLIELDAPASLVALLIHKYVSPEQITFQLQADGTLIWYFISKPSEATTAPPQPHKVLSDARETLHKKRKAHLKLVIQAFNSRLAEEGLWRSLNDLFLPQQTPATSNRQNHPV